MCIRDRITATYYAISAGTTEDAKEVFGNSRSYLVPVASPGDVYAEGYRTTVSLSEEDFKNAAQSAWNCTLEGDPSAWIGDITNNTSGYVSAIVIGGEARKGTEARKMCIRDRYGIGWSRSNVNGRLRIFEFDFRERCLQI